MALSYISTNPPGQRWQLSEEPIYPADRYTGAETSSTLWSYSNGANYVWSSNNPGAVWDGKKFVSPSAVVSVNENTDPNWKSPDGNVTNTVRSKISEVKRNAQNNNTNATLNAQDNASNAINSKRNTAYNQVLSAVNSTTGGDYMNKRSVLDNLDVDAEAKTNLRNSFDYFYNNEKVSPWDTSLAAKPPSPGGTKDLDTAFYKTQVPSAATEWSDAVKNGDLDYLSRYGDEDTFLTAHYSTQGKQNGIRGYAKQAEQYVDSYVEKPTDADKQRIADIATGTGLTLENLVTKVLGPKEKLETQQFGALAQNVLKDTIAQMNKVKAQESQYDLYKNFDSFAEIANMNKTLADSVLADSGIGGYLAMSQKKSEEDVSSDLEKQFAKFTGVQSNASYNWQKWFEDTLTEKYGIDYKQFESAENTLDIVNAALKADKTKIFDSKTKEFTKDFLTQSGFRTNADIVDFLSKQGDTGKNLLTTLQTSPETLNNDLTTLKGNLETTIKDLDAQKDRSITLTYKGEGDKTEQMKLDASFARSFIDEYLKPRFDYSKSMDEFKDYLDVSDKEKNIFQTTDRITEVKDYATSVAKAIQPDLATNFNAKFDYNFYFNPEDSVSAQKNDLYSTQTTEVNKDWENAKANPNALINPALPYLGTWAENAYYYGGIDLTNQEQFAKLHYQIKGVKNGYDAAYDPQSRLQASLESPLYNKAESMGTVFGKFTTPKEYVDELFTRINPLQNKTEWRKLMEKYGLDPDTEDLEVVKKQITDALSTGSAYEIRQKITDIQKLEQTPNQKNLGITYIERPEDKPNVEKTALYDTFKKAGFTGTEQEFYDQYMPDTSKEDIKFLSDITKGKTPTLDLSSLTDTKDPFTSMDKLESIFNPAEKKTDTKKDSYFKLVEDDDTSTAPTADSFLGDFTNFLKK